MPTPVNTPTNAQTDSNGLPLNAKLGDIARGNDGQKYFYDEMNTTWLLMNEGSEPCVVANTATPEELAEYEAVGHGICPNVVP